LPPSDYRRLSDEELVYRYAHRRDEAAMTALFERYGHLVYGAALNLLKDTEAAKDAMQQIFIQLLDDLVRFKIEQFKPWLFRVTRNFCLMQLRKKNPVSSTAFDEEGPLAAFDVQDEEALHLKVEEESRYAQLEAAVQALPPEQRACIQLFYLQKMTYAEVATKTGLPIQAVKSHLQNGRRNLKIKLASAPLTDPASV